jgi:hypothetical protein
MDSLEKSDRLHQLMSEIASYRKRTIFSMIQEGYCWKEIIGDKLWKVLPHVKSGRQYCEKECGVSHTTVYSYIKVAEVFGELVIKMLSDDAQATALIPLHESRLIHAASLATESTASEWLEKAISHNKEDWEDDLNEARNKPMKLDCEHLEKEPWERCKKCNKFFPL